MNTLFDRYGALNIEELIANQLSFLKIIEDGVVTPEEVQEQSERVVGILKEIDCSFNDEQKDKVKELLAELSVLLAIRGMAK